MLEKIFERLKSDLMIKLSNKIKYVHQMRYLV